MTWLRMLLLAFIWVGAANVPADTHVSLFGFKFEHKTTHSPSLELVIEGEQPSLTGHWSANLGNQRITESTWFPITVVDGHSRYMFTLRNAEKFGSGLLSTKTKWPEVFEFPMSAGILQLHGTRTGTKAKGTFVFTPDELYLRAITAHLQSSPTPIELLQLGFHDVPIDEAKRYAAGGAKLTASELIRFKLFGVTPGYVEALRRTEQFSANDIVKLRQFGVPETFPGELRSAGYKFSAEELVKLKNFGVKAEDAKEWKRSGFDLDVDGLVKMRNFGVSPEFGKAAREAFPNIKTDELVRLRNFGLREDYLKELKNVDHHIEPEEAIRLRNSGVTPDYIKSWRDAGFAFEVNDLIRLRNAGVPVTYASAVAVPNRKPLSADTIIRLRNRGLSPEEIRELRE